jgi:hypothetical protein
MKFEHSPCKLCSDTGLAFTRKLDDNSKWVWACKCVFGNNHKNKYSQYKDYREGHELWTEKGLEKEDILKDIPF